MGCGSQGGGGGWAGAGRLVLAWTRELRARAAGGHRPWPGRSPVALSDPPTPHASTHHSLRHLHGRLHRVRGHRQQLDVRAYRGERAHRDDGQHLPGRLLHGRRGLGRLLLWALWPGVRLCGRLLHQGRHVGSDPVQWPVGCGRRARVPDLIEFLCFSPTPPPILNIKKKMREERRQSPPARPAGGARPLFSILLIHNHLKTTTPVRNPRELVHKPRSD